MPRTSKRANVIEQLQAASTTRRIARAIRLFDSDSDSFEDAVDEAVEVSLAKAKRRRFLFRFSKYRKGSSEQIFQNDLDNDDYDNYEPQPWLSDDEFLQKYRMSRKNFKAVLGMIKDHEVSITSARDDNKPLQLTNFWFF